MYLILEEIIMDSAQESGTLSGFCQTGVGLRCSPYPAPSFLWALPGVPSGGQSQAETWSLLSDSTIDTRCSGKKWPVPTGEPPARRGSELS